MKVIMFKRFGNKNITVSKKELSALPWSTLSSLGSGQQIEKPEYIDLRDILEATYEGGAAEADRLYAAAQAENRARYSNYRKLKALNASESKAEEAPLLVPFKEEWVMPHLLTFFGTGQCKPILEDGVVNLKATLNSLSDKIKAGSLVFSDGSKVSLPMLLGMLKFMKVQPRGNIMPKGVTQGSPQGHRMSACVPLLFSAWKSYQGIGYNQYNYEDPLMEHVLEDDMIDLLSYRGTEIPWTSEELSKFKTQALYIKSTGGQRKVATCTMVYTIGDPDFDALPKLVKLLLLQLWVFQPELYKPYAIHNLQDLDAPAANIVTLDLFDKPVECYVNKKPPNVAIDVPWE